ncbi:MAG TPA: hypothetical protein VKZ63_21460 [Kofleriaceae bacterium]|nr:hypothetical protein [Kofleriaceae bacterium]
MTSHRLSLLCLLVALLSACSFSGSGAGADDGGADGDAGTDPGSPDGGEDTGMSCSEETPWTCQGDARVRCDGATVRIEECERGCLASPRPEGDAECVTADPAWDCDSSDYQGQQYWTCDPQAGQLHRCDGDGGVVVSCPHGCSLGPVGTDDSCRVAGLALTPPNLTFVISGGLFPESAVRGPVEEGVAYMLDRIAPHLELDPGASIPDITIYYGPSGNPYCSGRALAESTEIYCPSGYPIEGNNQNYVVNITIHEIGHIAALWLIASAAVRDTCENEGLATWMAGKYWMNVSSSPVPSLRDAARGEIALGRASATMTSCVLASDAPYKVYGSFFEYLEQFPGAIQGVADGSLAKEDYLAGWQAWLDP